MKGSFELQDDDASGHFIARSRLLSAMLNVRFEG
jgi:hypothetical protein